MRLWGEKRKEFCYAGDWSICINLNNGDITKCFCEDKIGNIFEDKKIRFKAVGNHCKAPYCYAGHAFLALGCCPSVDYGRFDTLRDRENSKWLQKEMKSFMHQKLKDNNKEYSFFKKYIMNIKWNIKKPSIKRIEKETLYSLSYSNAFLTTIMEGRRNMELYYKNNLNRVKWLYNDYCANAHADDYITIEALDKKNPFSKGTEIWLIGLIVNDLYCPIDNVYHEKWLKNKNMLGWRFYDIDDDIKKSIKIGVPTSDNIKVVFDSNKWRGKVKITWGSKNKIVDTYNSKTTGVKIVKL